MLPPRLHAERRRFSSGTEPQAKLKAPTPCGPWKAHPDTNWQRISARMAPIQSSLVTPPVTNLGDPTGNLVTPLLTNLANEQRKVIWQH